MVEPPCVWTLRPCWAQFEESASDDQAVLPLLEVDALHESAPLGVCR